MFKPDPTDTKPCPHMRRLVSALADEALTGLARWYTRRHIAGCAQCQKGLQTILIVQARLRALSPASEAEIPPLPPERWAAVEAAWEASDRERTQTPP